MSTDIKISILITTYNLSKYIDQTLHSVFSQNLDCKFEVLIGDDGSTDGTIEMIRKWIAKYPSIIRLYSMERIPGKDYNPIFRASLNRTNLADHARGEYITFLDGDDIYIDSNKLKKQIAILDNPSNQDCIMCAHNVNIWQETNNSTRPILPLTLGEQKISRQQYWAKYWVHAEAFIFRNIKRPSESPQFNIKYFDDNLIVFFYLKFGSIYYIPDLMVNYRQNITPWKSWQSLERSIINAMDLCIETNYNHQMYKSSIQRHYNDFKCLYCNRTVLEDKKYEKYFIQVQDDELTEVSLFFKYNTANIINKLKVHIIFAHMSLLSWEPKDIVTKFFRVLYWNIFIPCKQKLFKIIHKK